MIKLSMLPNESVDIVAVKLESCYKRFLNEMNLEDCEDIDKYFFQAFSYGFKTARENNL